MTYLNEPSAAGPSRILVTVLGTSSSAAGKSHFFWAFQSQVHFIGRSNDGLVMRRLPTGNWLELSPDLGAWLFTRQFIESAGTAMLVGDNIPGLRPESAANLAAPRACRIRKLSIANLLSGSAQCTSNSHSRLGGNDDASHRRREAACSGQR